MQKIVHFKKSAMGKTCFYKIDMYLHGQFKFKQKIAHLCVNFAYFQGKKVCLHKKLLKGMSFAEFRRHNSLCTQPLAKKKVLYFKRSAFKKKYFGN